MNRCRIIVTVAALLMALGARPTGAATPDQPDAAGVAYFEQHVRPILVAHCYECHSASSKIVQGGLLLDSRPGWEKGGDSGAVLVRGKPEQSLLVRAVEYHENQDVQMPPKGKLAEREIAAIAEWVRLGAPDPRATAAKSPSKRVIDIEADRKHWAFQPLAPVKPPEPKDASWCRTPIDRFIVAAYEANGLRGNPAADRLTLVRRAYFDLLGLPPSPDAVEAFLADKDPQAYEKLIDRLLADEHHGERWGRHWLDLARWGESHGFEQDYDRPYAYSYRDFVIRALNSDMPYDQFVRWQIAGDELAGDDPQALAATGFLGAGVHATQITANQAEKERYDELDDVVRTIGTSMLGLTIGCARCHDHKYDPIPVGDYYRMVATFATTVRSNQDVEAINEEYEAGRRPFYFQAKATHEANAAWRSQQASQQLEQLARGQAPPFAEPRWLVVDPVVDDKSGRFKKEPDGSVLAKVSNTLGNDTRTLNATVDHDGLRAIRLEALFDPRLPRGGPGLGVDGDFQLNGLKLQVISADGKQRRDIKFQHAWATQEETQSRASDAIDDKPNTGWRVKNRPGVSQVAVFVADEPFGFGPGTKLQLTLTFNGTEPSIGRVRLSVSAQAEPLAAGEDEITLAQATVLHQFKANGFDSLTPTQRTTLADLYLDMSSEGQRRLADVRSLLASAPVVPSERMMICSEGVPAIRLHTQGPDYYEKMHLLKRGEPNQKVEESRSGYLQVLVRASDGAAHWQQAPPAGSKLSYRRRALAAWMTDTEYGAGQLLARVIVNRLWYYHMGRGLVSTPSDFGFNGERPSHPELLDYLANELIRNGWRLKPIHRLIMTSSVYMQNGATDAARLKADVDNRWCWYRPMQRLEAESIRDAMLVASGRWDATMFGPSERDPLQRRRSIYFFVKRSKLVPMMVLFDGPDTLQDLAVRGETTIAPQSLMLLNSPAVRGFAEGLADRVIKPAGEDQVAGIASAYQIALGRRPTADEQQTAKMFLAEQLADYREQKLDKAERAAWADFCQALFCLNEFVFVK
ncbi:MAG: PSD1 domain-containing protein [Planctomycetes bacterium]|nr:PSD1 domain-containing protein [Planctomycetota bacterium]